MSPASSADMAPISSGSSTWTASGIPFSFVSMATGIGPSSSGSQATVASVLTSAFLAGLGFSGGVISSFPSSVWPSRGPPQDHQPAEDPASSAPGTGNALGGDVETCTGEGEDEEEQEEKQEEEDGDKKRKKNKRSGGVDGWSQEGQSHLTLLEDTHNALHYNSNHHYTCRTNQNAACSGPMDLAVALRPSRGGQKRSRHVSTSRGEHPIWNLNRFMERSLVFFRDPGRGSGTALLLQNLKSSMIQDPCWVLSLVEPPGSNVSSLQRFPELSVKFCVEPHQSHEPKHV